MLYFLSDAYFMIGGNLLYILIPVTVTPLWYSVDLDVRW
jgi:hypothetical protein